MMDCDQFHTLDDTMLSVEDLQMLRGYDQKGLTRRDNVAYQPGTVEDRYNQTRKMQCGPPAVIGRDGRYAGDQPYAVRPEDRMNSYYTWPFDAGVSGAQYDQLTALKIGRRDHAKAVEKQKHLMKSAGVDTTGHPKSGLTMSLKPEDMHLLFIFIIVVLVATCVYLSKSVHELKHALKKMLRKGDDAQN